MISMNLTNLRKRARLTQEELAEKIGVTRQAIAKWEKGERTPDLEKCVALSRVFQVSMDDLISYDEENSLFPIPPRGRYFFGSVTVGERGQIVIPKKARDVFQIKAGDQIAVLGDDAQGIALIPQSALQDLLDGVRKGETARRVGWRKEDE